MAKGADRFAEAAGRAGIIVEVRRFPEGTRTAADAARAVGCEIGQIVKSLVFAADGRPFLALTSGPNLADPAKLAALLGAGTVARANPEEARRATGYAIGGTPPFTPGIPSPTPSSRGPRPPAVRRALGCSRRTRRRVPDHARGPTEVVGRRGRGFR